MQLKKSPDSLVYMFIYMFHLQEETQPDVLVFLQFYCWFDGVAQ